MKFTLVGGLNLFVFGLISATGLMELRTGHNIYFFLDVILAIVNFIFALINTSE